MYTGFNSKSHNLQFDVRTKVHKKGGTGISLTEQSPRKDKQIAISKNRVFKPEFDVRTAVTG
jgi:hypothetical protein